MTDQERLFELLQSKLGSELHVGPWLLMDQERINRFAEVTGDQQWIHTDPERARRDSPYGATVAHGFLTLSLLPFLTESNHPEYFQRNYPGMHLRVNYGLNRVRFPAPVLVGSRIRARTVLLETELIPPWLQIIYRITVDIEGADKPACVAEFIARLR
ncbi:MAG TPA: MaoC family dehydratase [Geobacterales bacterium]|nr:MaoC family dehydratase [Geobacterales bacterium]